MTKKKCRVCIPVEQVFVELPSWVSGGVTVSSKMSIRKVVTERMHILGPIKSQALPLVPMMRGRLDLPENGFTSGREKAKTGRGEQGMAPAHGKLGLVVGQLPERCGHRRQRLLYISLATVRAGHSFQRCVCTYSAQRCAGITFSSAMPSPGHGSSALGHANHKRETEPAVIYEPARAGPDAIAQDLCRTGSRACVWSCCPFEIDCNDVAHSDIAIILRHRAVGRGPCSSQQYCRLLFTLWGCDFAVGGHTRLCRFWLFAIRGC